MPASVSADTLPQCSRERRLAVLPGFADRVPHLLNELPGRQCDRLISAETAKAEADQRTRELMAQELQAGRPPEAIALKLTVPRIVSLASAI